MTHTPPVFSVDSSAIIDAFEWFPATVAPDFVDMLDELWSGGRLIVPADVGIEITHTATDEVSDWMNARKKLWWYPSSGDDVIVQQVMDIRVNGHHPTYREFLATGRVSADPSVIVAAVDAKGIVVAHETSALDIKKAPPKIPDASAAMKVDCIRFSEMLQRAGIKFVRGK